MNNKTENEKNCKLPQSIIATESLAPIVIDFPSFVSSKSYITPSEWHDLFEHISPNVQSLTKAANENRAFEALGAIRVFCSSAIESFEQFSNSDVCDQHSIDQVLAFLRLFPITLSKIAVTQEQQDIYNELVQLIYNIQFRCKPLLVNTEADIFKQIHPLIDDYIKYRY